LSLRERRPGLIDRRLINARIDVEQRITLLDVGAVLEMNLRQVTAYPCADIDAEGRFGPTRELFEFGDFLIASALDDDFRRFGLSQRRRFALAAESDEHRSDDADHGTAKNRRTAGNFQGSPFLAAMIEAGSRRRLIMIIVPN